MNVKPLLIAIMLVLLTTIVASASPVTPVVGGLNAAIGQAYSFSDNSIYFVQNNSGQVSRFNLTTNTLSTIHSGLIQPEGIALFPGYGLAYITTRDGGLWKASTTDNTRRLVAGGLGEPHAIVLDPSTFCAYVTDFRGELILLNVENAQSYVKHSMFYVEHSRRWRLCDEGFAFSTAQRRRAWPQEPRAQTQKAEAPPRPRPLKNSSRRLIAP